jgi:hypothetical protein
MEELEQSSPFVSRWGCSPPGDRGRGLGRCLVRLATYLGKSAVARSIASSTPRAHRRDRFSLLDERLAALPIGQTGPDLDARRKAGPVGEKPVDR